MLPLELKRHTSSGILPMSLLVLFLVITGCREEPEKSPARLDQPASGSTLHADTLSLLKGSRPQPSKPVDEMSKAEREAYKKQLREAGFYTCCTDPDCSMCLYDNEECKCAEAAKRGDPVCGECYRGWQRGKGSLKDVNSMNIKRK